MMLECDVDLGVCVNCWYLEKFVIWRGCAGLILQLCYICFGRSIFLCSTHFGIYQTFVCTCAPLLSVYRGISDYYLLVQTITDYFWLLMSITVYYWLLATISNSSINDVVPLFIIIPSPAPGTAPTIIQNRWKINWWVEEKRIPPIFIRFEMFIIFKLITY